MNLFVYEQVTGGGYLAREEGPPPALRIEGQAILEALTTDLAEIDQVQVSVLRDKQVELSLAKSVNAHVVATPFEAMGAWYECCQQADAIILIAPETSGTLESLVSHVTAIGANFLSPTYPMVALASDKQLTSAHLHSSGINVPESFAARDDQPKNLPFPLVAKPSRGAGSEGVRLIEHPKGLVDWKAESTEDLLLTRFCPGTPVSLSVLAGPAGHLLLPACQQHQTDDGTFRYLGGSWPLPLPLENRAQSLAEQVVACLPSPIGYFGIDMVLGDNPSGADDVVIEVNPRFTTSYVGLRAACQQNLAKAMIDVAQGKEVSLTYRHEPITFNNSGTVVTTS